MSSTSRTARGLVVLAASALLTAGMAACGDKKDDTLSKAEVIKRGSAICKAAERKVARLPEIKSKNPFGKGTTAADHRKARAFLAGYADLLDSSRRGLAALKAPSEDKQLLDGYLSDVSRIVAALRKASKARGSDVIGEVNLAFVAFDKASKQTRAYGFPNGVCGSG